MSDEKSIEEKNKKQEIDQECINALWKSLSEKNHLKRKNKILSKKTNKKQNINEHWMKYLGIQPNTNKTSIQMKQKPNMTNKIIEKEKKKRKNEEIDSSEIKKEVKKVVKNVDDFLDAIKKKPKTSVLDKSKDEWKEYKDKDEEIKKELDFHKKSKQQYLDKIEFLNKAKIDEYDNERNVKSHT